MVCCSVLSTSTPCRPYAWVDHRTRPRTPPTPSTPQVGTLPAYAGLTLDGILSTSSHGPTLCKTLPLQPRKRMALQSATPCPATPPKTQPATPPSDPFTPQVGSLPAYAGLTLGGILSTSAHGSGDLTTSMLLDTVLEITWVDGKGEVHTSPINSPEAMAISGGMGTIGIITELKIKMTPPSNTRLVVSRGESGSGGDVNATKAVQREYYYAYSQGATHKPAGFEGYPQTGPSGGYKKSTNRGAVGDTEHATSR